MHFIQFIKLSVAWLAYAYRKNSESSFSAEQTIAKWSDGYLLYKKKMFYKFRFRYKNVHSLQ
jgi:hypothetical protein